MPSSKPPSLALYVIRHGATSANEAGLRCGGDLDLPLTRNGREQAQRAARALPGLTPPVNLIVTSDLLRTRETAGLLSEQLPGVPVRVLPAWGERLLGEWNLRPTGETQPWLDAGLTPPGGESEAEFEQRIRAALRALLPQLQSSANAGRRVLLVGSKGVARMLGRLCALPQAVALGNAEFATFQLPPRGPASRPLLPARMCVGAPRPRVGAGAADRGLGEPRTGDLP